MKLTEAQRRLLAEELLGECWHEKKGSNCSCGYTPLPPASFSVIDGELSHHINIAKKRHRTFATDTDMMDCMRALVKHEKWEEFYKSMIHEYIVNVCDRHYTGEACMVAWLFRPTDENGDEHFCLLIAQFLEQRKEK